MKKMFKLFILLVITIAGTSSQMLPSTRERVVACQYRYDECITITCPVGYTVSVISAMYGRTEENFCKYDTSNTNWYSNQISYAKNLCDNRMKCDVCASYQLFKDPCPGTTKYLGIYLLNFIYS